MNQKEKDIKFIKKGKLIVMLFGLLSIMNIIILIGKNSSYALFRRNVQSKRVIEIHTASKFPSKVLNENIKDSIASHTTETCNPTIEEDGITYFSGTNDCVNFNYVWYSGKLWRITAINPDNTMKIITQDAITSIQWGSSSNYKGSWIYQWLNEDFLDTLENWENIIVQNAKWDATEDANDIPVKPTGPSIVEGNVGLLNAYEYYQAYKNASDNTNYLNIGYVWWLINPCSNSNIRFVFDYGSFGEAPLSYYSATVRPSVNLKSDIIISGGKGTKENPYRISGDKEIATVDDKLNSRVSGEYVNFDGKKYRIVSVENETTKLTSIDYVRDETGAAMIKKFGSNNIWGTSVTSGDDNLWDCYLNNTWYNSINETYKKMLVRVTYYLGQYGGYNVSYKNAICSASNTTERTKECSKTSSTWTGYVGLPRVGEMFSTQLGERSSSTKEILLITPKDDLGVREFDYAGTLDVISPSSNTDSVRPSITLNSNVYITSGKGTNEKPYEIKCDSCQVVN